MQSTQKWGSIAPNDAPPPPYGHVYCSYMNCRVYFYVESSHINYIKVWKFRLFCENKVH